jgi:hypothetical protein
VLAEGIRVKVEVFGAVVLVARPSPKTEGFGPNSPGNTVQFGRALL